MTYIGKPSGSNDVVVREFSGSVGYGQVLAGGIANGAVESKLSATSADVSLNGYKLINLGTPVSNSHGTTMEFVNSASIRHKLQKLMVGNALNGATSLDSGFLDPGDGSGIIAAVSYSLSFPSSSFWIDVGPGNYTLISGSSLITIPSNVKRFTGASNQLTVISGTAVSGTSPQIIEAANPVFVSDLSLVSPTNVVGQATPSFGLVRIANNQRWERINLTVNCHATNVSTACRGFTYDPSSTTPAEDISFVDCNFASIGDTSTSVTFGYAWSLQAATNAGASTIPISFTRCSATCAGGAVRGIYCDANIEYSNLRFLRCVQGIVGSPRGGFTHKGIRGNGLVFDARGRATSTTVNAVYMGASTSGTTINGTQLHGIEILGDSNITAASTAVSIIDSSSGQPATYDGISIQISSQCSVAGAGGISFDTKASAWKNIQIVGSFGTGDIAITSAGGSFTDALFNIISCRNLTIPANAVKARVVGSSVSGTLTITSGATDTYVNNTLITTLADSGTRSVIIVDGGATFPAVPQNYEYPTLRQQYLGRAGSFTAFPGTGATCTIHNTLNPTSYSSSATGVVAEPSLAAGVRSTIRRMYMDGGTSTSAYSAVRSSNAPFVRGSVIYAGGFVFTQTFALGVPLTTPQIVCGLVAGNSALGATITPSNLTDCIFMGCDNGDTNLQIMTNDSSGTCTKTDLGSLFPRPVGVNTAVYEVTFFAEPGNTNVYYRVYDRVAKVLASGVISSNLPTLNTFLGWQCYVNVGGSNERAFLEWMGTYGETVLW